MVEQSDQPFAHGVGCMMAGKPRFTALTAIRESRSFYVSVPAQHDVIEVPVPRTTFRQVFDLADGQLTVMFDAKSKSARFQPRADGEPDLFVFNRTQKG